MTTGPIDRTITKLYPDTAILITGTISGYVNTSSAQIILYCGIGGAAVLSITGLWIGPVSEHFSFPLGMRYYWSGTDPPGGANYLGATTGAMTVAWTIWVSNATTTFYMDTNDHAAWTMSEVRMAG
jgi:hypothetical protein